MVDLGIPGLGEAEFIGRGGFGQVYRCRQEALNRTVAVKVLRMQEATEAEVRLFERECAAVGSLAWCPEIVSVYSTGTTPDGDPYMVMEYAPGGSLRDRLQSGTLTEAETRDLAVHMAKALSAAHGAGLLHRDVKPANILISHTGSPILADFGIAKALARSGNTSTAAMSGTIAYLAPELLEDQPATAASDIFSLGATLLEALTGRTPFSSGPNDTAASLMRRALKREDIDLSSVPVGDDFRQVLGRCLAIDPAARFATGADLLSALGVTAPAPVQEQTMVRPVAPDAPRSDDATAYRPRADQSAMPPVPPPPSETVVRASSAVSPPPGPVPLPPVAAPQPRRNTTLVAVLAALGVLALVAGIAVVTVLLTRSSENDTTASSSATGGTEKPDAETTGAEAVTPTPSVAPPVEYRQCWDGARVESGTPCSTDYDKRAIYWAFNIDSADFGCDGGAKFSDKWAYAHEQCSFPPDGDAIHLAIHFSTASRDGRLPEYGRCSVVDEGRQIMRCSGGSSRSQLVRYNSDVALFYASASKGEEAELVSVLQRMRSLDEVLYGIETDE